ncbi:hypothetical protein ATO49_14380 [Mycolicibacterium fortuitum subsp. fortuitum DSM 46621 = ATCC 6841 = JCM 6387]|nr:hypothetical protein ATO49_14380 [Mycolicibacterium fortuitum subsp. fortuitum DSM 46621 = ATCC 6841 = JCM 6387]
MRTGTAAATATIPTKAITATVVTPTAASPRRAGPVETAVLDCSQNQPAEAGGRHGKDERSHRGEDPEHQTERIENLQHGVIRRLRRRLLFSGGRTTKGDHPESGGHDQHARQRGPR